MIAISLQSGSNGNCLYVESGGVKLLFDAGISGVEAERRLAAHGRDIRDVNAVILSHDHADHIRYAGVYQRKYSLPLYVTEETLRAAEAKTPVGKLSDVRFFSAGNSLEFCNVTVQTIPTPHDGRDGAVFVIIAGQKRLGILTDLGHVFDELRGIVGGLDAVFIESNYDPDLLASGPYPFFLKKRIQGPGGHISNCESAELLLSAQRLKWACLAHLSGQNNDPNLALHTHRKIQNRSFPLYVASRFSATGSFSL